MSLTVTQASDVNILLRYLLGIPRGGGLDGHAQAKAAAERLADAAHKRLAAGLRAEDVIESWPSPAASAPGRAMETRS